MDYCGEGRVCWPPSQTCTYTIYHASFYLLDSEITKKLHVKGISIKHPVVALTLLHITVMSYSQSNTII